MTLRFGRWFLTWNRAGTWAAQFNGEGNYNYRGRKAVVTRITT